MDKRVKWGLPGLAAAFTVASGATSYWCKSPVVAGLLITMFALIAGLSVFAAVFEE